MNISLIAQALREFANALEASANTPGAISPTPAPEPSGPPATPPGAPAPTAPAVTAPAPTAPAPTAPAVTDEDIRNLWIQVSSIRPDANSVVQGILQKLGVPNITNGTPEQKLAVYNEIRAAFGV